MAQRNRGFTYGNVDFPYVKFTSIWFKQHYIFLVSMKTNAMTFAIGVPVEEIKAWLQYDTIPFPSIGSGPMRPWSQLCWAKRVRDLGSEWARRRNHGHGNGKIIKHPPCIDHVHSFSQHLFSVSICNGDVPIAICLITRGVIYWSQLVRRI